MYRIVTKCKRSPRAKVLSILLALSLALLSHPPESLVTAVANRTMIGRLLARDISALGSDGVAGWKADGSCAVVVAHLGSENPFALDFVTGLSGGTLGQRHLGAAGIALA